MKKAFQRTITESHAGDLTRLSRMVRVGMLSAFVAIVVTALGGCFYRNNNVQGDINNPAAGPQATLIFAPGNQPGIIVQANFNQYHRPGQQFGDWTIRASWRNPATDVTTATTAAVEIDTSGIGIATLSYDFLNDLLTQVNAAPETFTAEPGLQIEFFPAPGTLGFYAFP